MKLINFPGIKCDHYYLLVIITVLLVDKIQLSSFPSLNYKY